MQLLRWRFPDGYRDAVYMTNTPQFCYCFAIYLLSSSTHQRTDNHADFVTLRFTARFKLRFYVQEF
jgi:hypothetical protein